MRTNKHTPVLSIMMILLLSMPEFCFAAAGATQLSLFIQAHIIDQALYAFGGIAGAAIFYYAVRMIVDAYNEKAFTDITNSFIYVLIGFIVIALSVAFGNSFQGPAGIGTIIAPSLLIPGINSVSNFIITGGATTFTMMVIIAGLRMITSQGDEGSFTKWRKVLIGNCIGIVIMLISGSIVVGIQDTSGPGAIVEEMRGIALFLLTVIGFASVISLIIAGIFLVVSVDESLKDKAKSIVIGTLISLLIVLASYSLILTFI